MKSGINIKFVIHHLGAILILEAAFMLLDDFISFFYDKKHLLQLFDTTLITLVVGILLFYTTRKLEKLYTDRETFLIVTGGWIIISLFGTLPYLFTGYISSFTDAFFETMSGFTTTGASILINIEGLSKGVLFWRSETHWIGGIGIIVIFITIFNFIKNNNVHQLFSSEFSNVTGQKLYPKVIQVTKMLLIIYVSFTVLETYLLMDGGMSFFDSVCHSFGTIATGGFSTKNNSIEGFSPYIQYVIMFFMLLSGANFNLYIALFSKRKNIFKDEELRLYLFFIFFIGFIITLILFFKMHYDFEYSFRTAFFQVISIITATGFTSTDYLQWPQYAWILLIFLMFIGASSSSTGGGIKVIRVLISLKYIKQLFKKASHPRMVSVIKYNGKPVDPQVVRRVLAFIVMYLLIVVGSAFLLMINDVSATTSFGSVLTCMGGVGPGLELTGPASNFYALPDFSKWVLSFDMLVGRLEIFSVFVLFVPGFWKN
jgi:trk system potassium uptake protein TrkH